MGSTLCSRDFNLSDAEFFLSFFRVGTHSHAIFSLDYAVITSVIDLMCMREVK